MGRSSTRKPLATDKELSDFLKSAEKRAFKRTAYAVRDEDAALDVVQDAMIRLAEKYAVTLRREEGDVREERPRGPQRSRLGARRHASQ